MKRFLREVASISGVLTLCGLFTCIALPLQRPRIYTLCSACRAGQEVTTIYSARKRLPSKALVLATAGMLSATLACALLCKRIEKKPPTQSC